MKMKTERARRVKVRLPMPTKPPKRETLFRAWSKAERRRGRRELKEHLGSFL